MTRMLVLALAGSVGCAPALPLLDGGMECPEHQEESSARDAGMTDAGAAVPDAGPAADAGMQDFWEGGLTLWADGSLEPVVQGQRLGIIFTLDLALIGVPPGSSLTVEATSSNAQAQGEVIPLTLREGTITTRTSTAVVLTPNGPEGVLRVLVRPTSLACEDTFLCRVIEVPWRVGEHVRAKAIGGVQVPMPVRQEQLERLAGRNLQVPIRNASLEVVELTGDVRFGAGFAVRVERYRTLASRAESVGVNVRWTGTGPVSTGMHVGAGEFTIGTLTERVDVPIVIVP